MLAAFAQGVPRLWEKIIHRSLIPERNWVRGPGAKLDDGAQIFRPCSISSAGRTISEQHQSTTSTFNFVGKDQLGSPLSLTGAHNVILFSSGEG